MESDIFKEGKVPTEKETMPHPNIERNRLYDRAAQKRRARNKRLMEVDTPTEEMREVIRKSVTAQAVAVVAAQSAHASSPTSKLSALPAIFLWLLMFAFIVALANTGAAPA